MRTAIAAEPSNLIVADDRGAFFVMLISEFRYIWQQRRLMIRYLFIP